MLGKNIKKKAGGGRSGQGNGNIKLLQKIDWKRYEV